MISRKLELTDQALFLFEGLQFPFGDGNCYVCLSETEFDTCAIECESCHERIVREVSSHHKPQHKLCKCK